MHQRLQWHLRLQLPSFSLLAPCQCPTPPGELLCSPLGLRGLRSVSHRSPVLLSGTRPITQHSLSRPSVPRFFSSWTFHRDGIPLCASKSVLPCWGAPLASPSSAMNSTTPLVARPSTEKFWTRLTVHSLSPSKSTGCGLQPVPGRHLRELASVQCDFVRLRAWPSCVVSAISLRLSRLPCVLPVTSPGWLRSSGVCLLHQGRLPSCRRHSDSATDAECDLVFGQSSNASVGRWESAVLGNASLIPSSASCATNPTSAKRRSSPKPPPRGGCRNC